MSFFTANALRGLRAPACLEVWRTPSCGSFYLLHGLPSLRRCASHLELTSLYSVKEASRCSGPRRARNQPSQRPGDLRPRRGLRVGSLSRSLGLFILESTVHCAAWLIPGRFYCFVLSLDIQQTKSCTSALFPRIILLLLSFLHLHVNLGISLPIKKKKKLLLVFYSESFWIY